MKGGKENERMNEGKCKGGEERVKANYGETGWSKKD